MVQNSKNFYKSLQMLPLYFCQTRSWSSDYSNTCWKLTPHYTASPWKTTVPSSPSFPTKREFQMNPSTESTWTRPISIKLYYPPLRFHNTPPALQILQQPQWLSQAFAGGAADLALRSQRSPSFLFCGGFPTITVNSSIIHPVKRALPFFTHKNVKGDWNADFLSWLSITSAWTSWHFIIWIFITWTHRSLKLPCSKQLRYIYLSMYTIT